MEVSLYARLNFGTQISVRCLEVSVVERCPLYGGVTVCKTQFWDSNICPLFGGVRWIEVSVDGGSTVRGAKTEVSHCLRCCIFEAKTLFCVQSLVWKPIVYFHICLRLEIMAILRL